MKRALIDLSSVIWTSLLAGEDAEFARWYVKQPDDTLRQVSRHEGRATKGAVCVNSGAYGYENAVNHLLAVMDDIGVQPHQMILVAEGRNSKAERQYLLPTYKAGRDHIEPQYEEFQKCREMLVSAFLALGANLVWQDGGVEADDVLGYLAQHLDGEKIIVSADKDLAQLVDPARSIRHWRMGTLDANPFGDFPHRLIPVCIALVGDSSDRIPGAHGFGKVAFAKLQGLFGDDGLYAMEGLIRGKRLIELQEDVGELKELQKVIDDADNVYLSYELGRLRTEKVNTMRRPLSWRAGMVQMRELIEDDRLRKFASVVKLVTAENYAEAVAWARQQIARSPFVALDVETSTPPESDEWIERLGKNESKVPVDVFGSELMSLQMTFGPNLQYTVYLPVDNVPEPGVSNLTIAQVRDFVGLVPRDKHLVIQNCSFELPVCFNAWGKDWERDPEWHGFLPNAIDTKIMGSYVDENSSNGLKQMSKNVLGYEQTSYAQVTTKQYIRSDWDGVGRVRREYSDSVDMPDGSVQEGPTRVEVEHKMNELTAREVLKYGADDTICTAALAVHFRTIMEIEGSWDVFMAIEQLPAYVTAKAFIDGADFSLEAMRAMEREDDAAFDAAWATLRAYLIQIGFEGTVRPTFTEFAPAAIKEAHLIITGRELKTQVRTPSKLAKLIRQASDEGFGDNDAEDRARLLAECIERGDLGTLNALVAQHFTGEPQLDLNSPKQMAHLLYDRMQLPINVVNEATPLERKGNPELAEALRKFKQYRLGKVSEITPDEWALVRVKAKANDDAIDFALEFDQEHVDDAARAALKAIGKMKKVLTRRQLFYHNYWNLVHWKDGKIHAQANQCAAVTRRYSYSSPNVQQLPKKGEGVKFRACYVPHHRKAVIASIDWTGQELRLAAERSQDRNMLACYIGEKLKDLHSITAAGAMKLKWGVVVVRDAFAQWGADLADDGEGQYDLFVRLRKLGKIDPMGKKAEDLRKDSKNVNFAAQFGAQAVKISETLIMPVADAQLFLDARAEMFPGVDEAAKRAESLCKELGYATTMLGVRRHLREAILSDDRQAASRAARQAWNMEIQGSAAEMAKAAMSSLWKSGALYRFDVRFIAIVHDELVVSVHSDHALEYLKLQHACMTQTYADMRVPILASISLGPNFAEQYECGDWFIPENIQAALNKLFPVETAMKEAA